MVIMGYTEKFAEVYEDLQKAIRDRSHLTQKVITDKNGHTRKVWVKTDKKAQATNNKKNTSKDIEYSNSNGSIKVGDKFKMKYSFYPEDTEWQVSKLWKTENGDVGIGIKPISLKPGYHRFGAYGVEISDKTEILTYDIDKIMDKKNKIDPMEQKKKEEEKYNTLPDNFYSYDTKTQDAIKNTKYAIATVSYVSDYGNREPTYYKVAVAVPKGGMESLQSAAHNAVYGTRGSGSIQLKSFKQLSPKDFATEKDIDLKNVVNTVGYRNRYEKVLSESKTGESDIMTSYYTKEEVSEQQTNGFLNWLKRTDLYKNADSGDKWFDYQKRETEKLIRTFNSVLEQPGNYSEKTVKNAAKELNESIGKYKAALYIKNYGIPKNTNDAINWYNKFDVKNASPEFRDYVSNEKIKTDR